MNKERLKKLKHKAFDDFVRSRPTDENYVRVSTIFWKVTVWYDMLYLLEDLAVPSLEGENYMP